MGIGRCKSNFPLLKNLLNGSCNISPVSSKLWSRNPGSHISFSVLFKSFSNSCVVRVKSWSDQIIFENSVYVVNQHSIRPTRMSFLSDWSCFYDRLRKFWSKSGKLYLQHVVLHFRLKRLGQQKFRSRSLTVLPWILSLWSKWIWFIVYTLFAMFCYVALNGRKL